MYRVEFSSRTHRTMCGRRDPGSQQNVPAASQQQRPKACMCVGLVLEEKTREFLDAVTSHLPLSPSAHTTTHFVRERWG